MTDEQRAAFEAWISPPPFEKPLERNPAGSGFPGQYRAYEVQLAWEAYQAGRAALQSQDAEDAERLNWLESVGSVDIVKTLEGKTEVFAPDDDMIYATGAELREAIDHARRVEGDGE